MKTDELIDNLTAEFDPRARPVARPFWRAAKWTVAAGLCVLAGIALAGLRADIGQVLISPSFVLESLAAFAVAVSAAVAAFVLSVPGAIGNRGLVWIALPAPLVWVGQLVIRSYGSGLGLSQFHWSGYSCAVEILVFGIVPGILLFIMLRSASPTRLGLNGAFALLATSAIGAFGLQFTCRTDDPLHLFIWHLIPLAIAGLVGISAGRWLLRW